MSLASGVPALNPMLGVFLDLDTVDRDDLDTSRLRSQLDEWHLHGMTEPAAVAQRVRDAVVVVTNKVVLDAPTMEQARRLRLICVAATGTNNVDLVRAKELGICVTNVTGYGTPSVVQHVYALILALTTRLEAHSRAARDGTWAGGSSFCVLDYPFRELAGKTLGIVGMGELGRGVARVGPAFGMSVLVAQRPGGDPRPERLPLRELLPRVDVLSLHCPLTPATRDLIGEAELSLMRPSALLINTARGGIVDERALAQALRLGIIGGAGVDVLSREPPVDGNPLLAEDIPNLILTPHVAWASRESRQRLLDEVAENIIAFLAGRERNRVS